MRRSTSAESAARFLALRQDRAIVRRRRRYDIERRKHARDALASVPSPVLEARRLRPKPEAILARLREHWTRVLVDLDPAVRQEIFEDFDLRVASGASREEAAAAVMRRFALERVARAEAQP